MVRGRIGSWATVAVVLAGCGQAPATTPVGPPVWTTATCPRPPAHAVVVGEPPGRHAIPPDFHPAWVLRCVISRTPTGRLVELAQRADLTTAKATSLVRSLRQPSAASGADCPRDAAAHTVIVTYFALVDATGRALIPGLPSDRCGRPSPAPVAALSALTYVELSATPVELTRPYDGRVNSR